MPTDNLKKHLLNYNLAKLHKFAATWRGLKVRVIHWRQKYLESKQT